MKDLRILDGSRDVVCLSVHFRPIIVFLRIELTVNAYKYIKNNLLKIIIMLTTVFKIDCEFFLYPQRPIVSCLVHGEIRSEEREILSNDIIMSFVVGTATVVAIQSCCYVPSCLPNRKHTTRLRQEEKISIEDR
jgi:hypothetical protein